MPPKAYRFVGRRHLPWVIKAISEVTGRGRTVDVSILKEFVKCEFGNTKKLDP